MSRLRPRFNRRMFREPEIRGGWSMPFGRADVVNSYEQWLHRTYAQDPQAYEMVLQLRGQDDGVDPQSIAEAYDEMPREAQRRVDQMQVRLAESEQNFERAYDAKRPPRTEARRYTRRR